MRSTTDPYGRKTYYLYDQNDNVIKTIAETVPQGIANVPAFQNDKIQSSAAHTYTLTDKAGNTLSTANTHKVTYTDARDVFLNNLQRQTIDDGSVGVSPASIPIPGNLLSTKSIDANGYLAK